MKPGYSKYVFVFILFMAVMSLLTMVALLVHHEVEIFD